VASAHCFSNVKLLLTSAAGNVSAFPVTEYVPAPALPGILWVKLRWKLSPGARVRENCRTMRLGPG
jgi:hypothetical protein